MSKRYEFSQVLEAVTRFNSLSEPDSHGTRLWNWIGVEPESTYIKDYSNPNGGYFSMEPNARLDMLLGPYWQVLMKAWKLRNETSSH